MGNSDSSESSSDTETMSDVSDDREEDSDLVEALLSGQISAYDLSVLFEDEKRFRLLSKKGDAENNFQNHRPALLRLLKEEKDSGEETVKANRLIELLENVGFAREARKEVLAKFDLDGNGEFPIDYMIEAIKGYNPNDLLQLSLTKFKYCSDAPSIIDCFPMETLAPLDSAKMWAFLHRNRATVHSVAVPVLANLTANTGKREEALKHHFDVIKTRGVQPDLGNSCLTNKCWTEIEVSSNLDGLRYLTDENSSSYWQSNGPSHSHWIRLKLKPDIILQQVYVSISAEDSSYCPELAAIYVGNTVGSLHFYKEVRIAHSMANGFYLLAEAMGVRCRYIQINILRNFSDGCDTRIHGVKLVGLQSSGEREPSVLEASQLWALQLLSSMVKLQLPMSGPLRQLILENSFNALRSIPPLSLGTVDEESDSRPISNYLLDEVHSMSVALMATIDGDDESVLANGILASLGFVAARGHVANCVDTIQRIVERHADTVVSLKKLNLIEQFTKSEAAALLKLSNSLELVLIHGDCEQSEEAKKNSTLKIQRECAVLMKVKGGHPVQLAGLKLKFSKSAKGNRRGLVFVINDELTGENATEITERFAQCDVALWERCQKEQSRSSLPADLVASFTTDESANEVDAKFFAFPLGKHVVIKFMQPAGSEYTVELRGSGLFRSGSLLRDEPWLPRPVEEAYPARRLCLHMLAFLTNVAEDYVARIKGGKSEVDHSLSFVGLRVEHFTRLLDVCCARGFKEYIPWILKLLNVSSGLMSQSGEHAACSQLFDFLAAIVDDPARGEAPCLSALASRILKEGAVLFLPDVNTRRDKFFAMFEENRKLGSKLSPSSSYLLQSMCRYFGNENPQSLLNLEADRLDTERIISVMRTLIVAAGEEIGNSAQPDVEPVLTIHTLVNPLQTYVFSVVRELVRGSDADEQLHVNQLMVDYVSILCEHVVAAWKVVVELELPKLLRFKESLVGSTWRQFLLLLLDLSACLDLSVLRHTAKAVVAVFIALQDVKRRHPTLFDSLGRVSELAEAKKWELTPEAGSSKKLTCSGATLFEVTVQTESPCASDVESESGNDEESEQSITFVDSHGGRRKHLLKSDEKKPIEIASSDSLEVVMEENEDESLVVHVSVVAKKAHESPLNWFVESVLSCAQLIGRVCSRLIANQSRFLSGKAVGDPLLESSSDLWVALFRGGALSPSSPAKLQRSLSGYHHSECPDELLQQLLSELLDEESSHTGDDLHGFVAAYRAQKKNFVPVNDDLERTATTVFLVLIWHTQPLRDRLKALLNGNKLNELDAELLRAYEVAQKMKLFLLNKRQQFAESPSAFDQDPVEKARKKARFLLTFAGMGRAPTQPAHGEKLKDLHRQSDDTLFHLESGIQQKYHSFRLVSDFISNQLVDQTEVVRLLEAKQQQAECAIAAHTHAASVLRATHVLTGPVGEEQVAFLQELCRFQEQFPAHYLSCLEGCSLAVENRLRVAHFDFLGECLSLLRGGVAQRPAAATRCESKQMAVAAMAILHVITQRWQDLDLKDLMHMDVVSALVHIGSHAFVGPLGRSESLAEESKINDEEEMKRHKKLREMMKRYQEDPSSFMTNYRRLHGIERDLHMFVSTFAPIVDVSYTCDGCGASLPGDRYRCLDCIDFDYCSVCFSEGYKQHENHKENHRMVLLQYQCDECTAFIMGGRVHCEVCPNFDLCYGCFKDKQFPTCHEETHEISVVSPKYYSSGAQELDALPSYIRHHSRILFCQLVFNMLDMYKHSSDRELYSCSLRQLVEKCLQPVKECIECLLTGSSPGADEASTLEVSLAVQWYPRMLGLLGAMLHDELKAVTRDIVLKDSSLLRLLISLAKEQKTSEHVHSNCLAVYLATRMCADCDPQEVAALLRPPDDSFSEFLLNLGGEAFAARQLNLVHSVMRCVRTVLGCEKWAELALVGIQCRLQLDTLLSASAFSSTAFCLLLLSELPPRLLVLGQVLQSTHSKYAVQKGVVIRRSGKSEALLVGLCSRREYQADSDQLEPVAEAPVSTGTWFVDDLSTLLRALILQWEALRFRASYLAVLLLKAMDRVASHSEDPLAVFSKEYIQHLALLASRGTQKPPSWQVADLEVLLTQKLMKLKECDSEEEDATEQQLHEMIQRKDWASAPCSLPDCHPDKEASEPGGLADGLSSIWTRRQGLRTLKSRVDSSDESESGELVDSGVASLSNSQTFSVGPPNEAAEEAALVGSENLIGDSRDEDDDELVDSRRKKSRELLHNHESSEADSGDEQLVETAKAVAILYARKHLLRLLYVWSKSGRPINAELLCCADNRDVACFIDLLLQSEDPNLVKELLRNIIKGCHHDSVDSIISASCQFLADTYLLTASVETGHVGEKKAPLASKITLHGATSLRIKFDPRCHLPEDDCLLFSTSEDLSAQHTFSGTNWLDATLPGDTLHYSYQGKAPDSFWGFKFVVAAGKIYRFETGFIILDTVLQENLIEHWSAVADIWKHVVTLACIRTGNQRLKAIRLLVEVVRFFKSRPDCDQGMPPFDLSLLRPLWRLYSKLPSNSDDHILPPLLRALTELFYHMEECALANHFYKHYLAELRDPEDMKKTLAKVAGKLLTIKEKLHLS